MSEPRSALAEAYRPGETVAPRGREPGVTLAEVLGRDLVQVAGWPKSFDKLAKRLGEILTCDLPKGYAEAATKGEVTLFPVGPERLWVTCPVGKGDLFGKLTEAFAVEEGVVTELGHSRTIIRISGPAARATLAQGLAIDLDPSVFKPGSFCQSSIHHIGLLAHCIEPETLDLYVPRGFALSFWEWLIEAAAEAGHRVEPPIS